MIVSRGSFCGSDHVTYSVSGLNLVYMSYKNFEKKTSFEVGMQVIFFSMILLIRVKHNTHINFSTRLLVRKNEITGQHVQHIVT